MSSYAPLTIDGVEVASFRNGVDLSVAVLFGPREFHSRPAVGDEVERWEHYGEDEEVTIHELISTGVAVRDRLDALGLGLSLAEEVFDQLIAEELETEQGFIIRPTRTPEITEGVDEEVRVLKEMTLGTWIERVRELYKLGNFEGESRNVGSFRWLIGLWEESDGRLMIRALLAALPETAEVRIDVTDIVEGGYMSLDTNPRDEALEWMGNEIISGTPVVILTEGVSDTRILEQTLEVLRPHLKGYLRFPDFSLSPESNASALVRTLKSFASAGIRNRVVAIFDNDTAAEDALRSLDKERLPRNFSVLRLPDLPLAAAYPPLGPSGMVDMDINGLAGSIELYLGEDVLRDENGDLRPVQWRGFHERLQRYQGEVVHKRQIQEAFDAKVKAALSEEVPYTKQDWSGLELVLDTLIKLLAAKP
jgi:hypothetical protein